MLQRLQCRRHAARPGDDGQVCALAHHVRPAQRNVQCRVHGPGLAPELLVLHVDHGVAAGEARLEQAEVVLRRGRHRHHQAGQVREPGLQRLRMLRCRGRPDADGHARHQRHAPLAAEHVAVLRCLVDDLVHGAQREVDDAHLHHRPQARQGHAHGRTHDVGLGDGGVDDAPGTELLRQPTVLAEDAAAAQVLAQRDDVRVGLHGLLQRQCGGRCIGELLDCAHFHTPAPLFMISS